MNNNALKLSASGRFKQKRDALELVSFVEPGGCVDLVSFVEPGGCVELVSFVEPGGCVEIAGCVVRGAIIFRDRYCPD